MESISIFAAGMIAGVFGLYAAWGIAFVILAAAIVIAEISFLEYENGKGATLTLLIAGAAVALASPQQISIGWALSLIPQAARFGVYYFAIGGLWSIAKWYFYTLDLRSRYDAFRERENGIGGDIKNKGQWIGRVRTELYGHSGRAKSFPPNAQEHASTILMWIGHWPFSMVWTLVNHPVRRVVRWIFARLRKVYYAISKHNFAGVEADL